MLRIVVIISLLSEVEFLLHAAPICCYSCEKFLSSPHNKPQCLLRQNSDGGEKRLKIKINLIFVL